MLSYIIYFREVFERIKCEEGERKSLRLEIVEEKVFRMFNYWVNTMGGKIACMDKDNNQIPITLMDLAHLWTHAKTWRIHTLQDQVMRRIFGGLPTEKEDKVMELLIFACERKSSTLLKKLAITKLADMVTDIEDLEEFSKGWKHNVLVHLVARVGLINKALKNGLPYPTPKLEDFLVDPQTVVPPSRPAQPRQPVQVAQAHHLVHPRQPVAPSQSIAAPQQAKPPPKVSGRARPKKT